MFDDETGTIFRDVVTLALAGFVAVVILLLPWINPPGTEAAHEARPLGDLIFESSWPKEYDTDIDQWVKAPGETPIGYSNKGGESCDLLRDDLGAFVDPLELNHEVTVCRGIRTAGEYVFNLHLYRNKAGALPVPVNVQVSARAPDGTTQELVRAREVKLDREGHELTAVRFRLTEEATIVPDSLHSMFAPLRSGGGQK